MYIGYDQALEDEEDAALLVDYNGTLKRAKSRLGQDAPTHAQTNSSPVQHRLTSAKVGKLSNTDDPCHAMAFDIEDELGTSPVSERQNTSYDAAQSLLIDIDDSPMPQQHKAANQKHSFTAAGLSPVHSGTAAQTDRRPDTAAGTGNQTDLPGKAEQRGDHGTAARTDMQAEAPLGADVQQASLMFDIDDEEAELPGQISNPHDGSHSADCVTNPASQDAAAQEDAPSGLLFDIESEDDEAPNGAPNAMNQVPQAVQRSKDAACVSAPAQQDADTHAEVQVLSEHDQLVMRRDSHRQASTSTPTAITDRHSQQLTSMSLDKPGPVATSTALFHRHSKEPGSMPVNKPGPIAASTLLTDRHSQQLTSMSVDKPDTMAMSTAVPSVIASQQPDQKARQQQQLQGLLRRGAHSFKPPRKVAKPTDITAAPPASAATDLADADVDMAAAMPARGSCTLTAAPAGEAAIDEPWTSRGASRPLKRLRKAEDPIQEPAMHADNGNPAHDQNFTCNCQSAPLPTAAYG